MRALRNRAVVGGVLWQRWGARFSLALAAGAYLLGTLLLFWGRRTAGDR